MGEATHILLLCPSLEAWLATMLHLASHILASLSPWPSLRLSSLASLCRSMRRPIQLETSLRPLDVCTVEAHEDLFCDVMVRELNKAVTHRRSFQFISDQFDGLYGGNVLKQS